MRTAAGRRPLRVRSALGFAPSHVTGVFSPRLEARDPRGRGSVGAGLVLDLGVTARAQWIPGPRRRLIVRSAEGRELPISREVAERMSAGRLGSLTVVLDHALPIGQGFGSSAAGALATGRAVAQLFGRPEHRAIETAHLADLYLGGGLGGVSAILGGGLEQRRRPGIPPWGKVVHRRFPYPVIVSVVGGPVPSPTLLRDPRFLDRVRSAARAGLDRIGPRDPVAGFLDATEAFSDALALAAPGLRRTILALRSTGARAAQAMFGRSVFAVAPRPGVRRALLRELERRRLPALELRAAPPRLVAPRAVAGQETI